MQASDSAYENWENQTEVNAILLETGVSLTKMARWRHEGLLPDVSPVPNRYHGSAVHYPPGTCRQIAAAARLFKIKASVPYVGWHLWWEGYPVDENYWRAPLIESARTFEKHLLRVVNLVRQSENTSGKRTLQEKFAESTTSNFILSRIRRRLWGKGLAAHVAVILSVASGDFVGFSLPGPNEEKAFDQERTIEAFDFAASQRDSILGKRLNLVPTLSDVLATMSRAIRSGTLLEIVNGPEGPIAEARDDVRNTYRIVISLYEALSWIYGPEAFGLRLAAWVAKKHTKLSDHLTMLGVAALRRASNDYCSSQKIKEMADQAEKARHDSLAMKALWKNDPRFREVFRPKRIRQGYRDKPSHENFKEEIILARELGNQN